ncbi:MAG: hypothetical protein HZB38_03735 [Planctomycetes bacterium]|nr:hypothetical protein [Planctomycetota bacterium]
MNAMKMRLVAVLAGSLAFAGTAFADYENVNDVLRFYEAEGTVGGEYIGQNLTQPALAQFRTFCLERHVMFDFDPAGFNVAGVTDRAMLQNDPLSAQVAYLYTQFRAGSLSSYDYGAGRAISADELQEAMWYLENEIPASDGQAAAWIAEANAAVAVGGSWYNSWGNGAGGYDGLDYLGTVRVLNLTWATTRGGFNVGDDAQDMLTLIPAPGAALLGTIGLAFLRALKRKA